MTSGTIPLTRPFVTVTRVVGCGGRQVAWLLGDELQRPVFDVEKLLSVEGNDAGAHLRERVLSIAESRPAIFLDGGADLVLPRERGFRVRLVAGRETCIANIRRRFDLPQTEAEELYERTEHERAEFIRKWFSLNPFDPTRHDLILNLEHISPQRAVRTIRAAMEEQEP